jgi:hypothetical protein
MKRQLNKTGMVWSHIVPSWTTANIVMPASERAMYETPSEARREQNRNAIELVAPPRAKEQIHNAFR